MEITLIEKEPRVAYSRWLCGDYRYVDVYWKGPDGKEHLLMRRLLGPAGDTRPSPYAQSEINEGIRDRDAFRDQLAVNGGAWLDRYSVGMDPVRFIASVREKGWSFTHTSVVFVNFDGTVRFSGNLNECSRVFSYDVFSKDLIRELMEAVPEVAVRRLDVSQPHDC